MVEKKTTSKLQKNNSKEYTRALREELEAFVEGEKTRKALSRKNT